ncbi:hypothetical protein H9649_09425 [Sporosarcina sp. Sa2YVA2]|uniref:Uncharacterized protein n=1 Tax=Sporosarcina quadrami TaxID=2762234 RepID=A0ABR8U9T4_9BACL|nr:hypothetical protein [Sporosarcina quadrami]MBD7984802.1 hypothetical protein [Sporosarcina quadrami]
MGKIAALVLAVVVVLCSLAIVWSVGPAVSMLAKYESDYERSKMFFDATSFEIGKVEGKEIVLRGGK